MQRTFRGTKTVITEAEFKRVMIDAGQTQIKKCLASVDKQLDEVKGTEELYSWYGCIVTMQEWPLKPELQRRLDALARKIELRTAEHRCLLSHYYELLSRIVYAYRAICIARWDIAIVEAGGWPNFGYNYNTYSGETPYTQYKSYTRQLEGFFSQYLRSAKRLGISTSMTLKKFILTLDAETKKLADSRDFSQSPTLSQLSSQILFNSRTVWPSYLSIEEIFADA